MPFEHGTINATFFRFDQELPENALELFAARHAGSLDTVADEPQIGWVSGRHLLDNQISEANALRSGFFHFNLRKADRKIPPAYLNALCKQEEEIHRKAHDLEFISKKLKKEIREDIIEKNLMKMPPSLSGIPVVVAPHEQVLFVGASSTAQIDLFVEYFMKCTGVEPVQFIPGQMLERLFSVTESSFPKLHFAPDAPEEDATIGRDFLTWLWFHSETGEPIHHEQFGNFDLMIEGPLTFAAADEAQGAAEVVIKKGDFPQRSAEAKAALLIGKKLKKAKFSITRNEEIWTGTFDADKFAVGSLKLPEGEFMGDEELFEERMQSMIVFQNALESFFRKFGESLLTPDFENYQKKLQRWAVERDAK